MIINKIQNYIIIFKYLEMNMNEIFHFIYIKLTFNKNDYKSV